MQAFTAARTDDTRDEIWLTEHPPVYTLGLAGRREHLLRDNGIPVLAVDRGGQVTYHGPGQLVAYLLVDLRRRGFGIRALVRAIEAAVVEWLGSMRIRAYGKPAAPGVYVRVAGAEAKIAALGLRVKQRLHLPRPRAQRRDGPFAFPRHRSLRLQGARGDAARRLRRRAHGRGGRRRARADPGRAHRGTQERGGCMSADAPLSSAPGVKQKGAAKTARIPIKVVAGRAPEEARVDPRARAVVAALLRDQEDPARAPAAHGVRGSVVPEHRRVLRQGHGDVHDHGRHLHAALPVLRRRPRPPAAARRRRAGEPRADDRRAEAALRRHHQRRPRRPARRRRAALRRLHPRGARALAGDADRSPGAGLPRPDGARARRPGGRPARRDEPQPRDGAAAVQAGAAGLRLRALARAAPDVQGRDSRRSRPSRG